MNQAWASSLDNLWHSPNLPMWLTIAAAGFFAVVLLVTLFRAERSVANGALTVITLLAIGIAVTGMMRASGIAGGQSGDPKSSGQAAASLPALACLDGLAGESVETACEKALFASADSVAAGVSYTAAQVTRLAAFGNAAAANKVMTPELSALRRTIERDRYGLVAQGSQHARGLHAGVAMSVLSIAHQLRADFVQHERKPVRRVRQPLRAVVECAARGCQRRCRPGSRLGAWHRAAPGTACVGRLPECGVDPSNQHHDARDGPTGRTGVTASVGTRCLATCTQRATHSRGDKPSACTGTGSHRSEKSRPAEIACTSSRAACASP